MYRLITVKSTKTASSHIYGRNNFRTLVRIIDYHEENLYIYLMSKTDGYSSNIYRWIFLKHLVLRAGISDSILCRLESQHFKGKRQNTSPEVKLNLPLWSPV